MILRANLNKYIYILELTQWSPIFVCIWNSHYLCSKSRNIRKTCEIQTYNRAAGVYRHKNILDFYKRIFYQPLLSLLDPNNIIVAKHVCRSLIILK